MKELTADAKRQGQTSNTKRGVSDRVTIFIKIYKNVRMKNACAPTVDL